MTLVWDDEAVLAEDLASFFEGWASPPDIDTRLRILLAADGFCVARIAGQVVGFATVITDKVSCAFIPLLEVLPEYRGQGIGSAIVRSIVERYGNLYALDLCCDLELLPFYERLGFTAVRGAVLRNPSAFLAPAGA